MTGSIKTYTPNFKMIIPEFNTATWHDYIEENFRSIDALFHNLFGINGFSGIWKTNTEYKANQVLFIGEDNGSQYEGRLVKVIQDTNTAGFATFSDAIKRYPNHYEMYADASSAEIYATLAQDWATKTGSTIKTPTGEDTGEYSAKHHAQLAAQHEEACEMYRNLAKTDAGLAKESENEAANQAEIATTQASLAKTSATNAKNSETNANTSKNKALEWATKTDAKVKENGVDVDYSSKAYAIGGVGTEQNNAKYYKEKADFYATSAAKDAATAQTAANDKNVIAVGEDIRSSTSLIKNVAYNKTNIITVAGIEDNINTVASNISNIGSVASNISSINAVNENKNNINSVNNNKTNIDKVANNQTNINTTATNISAINNCSTNMSAIKDAPNQANRAKQYADQAQAVTEGTLNETQITNCITEIPQDIKLELDNGTLTLKAGSKAYFPNGTGVFDLRTTTNDISILGYGTGTRQLMCFIRYNLSSIDTSVLANISSGSGSFSGIGIYYNTTTNNIDYYSSGSAQGRNYCLPIALITMTDSTITSIDQVFNGFGFIGSTVFALPGVKGLIPNGRNEDGTLKNIEFTVSNVISETRQDYGTAERVLKLGANYISGMVKTNYRYDETNNFNYESNNLRNYVILGKLVTTNNKIDSFTMPTAFHAVDYNDFNAVKDAIPTKQDIATAVNYDNITNCITEIPQDIKLELNNGTLTLKAGSKVYVPNGKNADGSNKFDEVIFNSDKSIKQKYDNNGIFLIMYIRPNGTQGISSAYKGSTLTNRPTSVGDYRMHYITSENKIFLDSPNEENNLFSLPLAIVSRSSTVGFTSIDQVFNGFGYIGSTVFALPGVKGTISNGHNEDGSLKNIYFVNNKVKITSNTGSGRDWTVYSSDGGFNRVPSTAYKFDIVQNKYITVAENADRFFCVCGTTTGDITSFNPKAAFRAVDYNDAVLNYGDQDIGGNKNFTGTLKAPTPSSATDNSNNIATTAWFRNALTSLCPTIRMTKKEDIASNGLPYTATANGIIRVKIGATYSWQLMINGTIVQEQERNNSDSCVTTWILIPVKNGDVLTASGNAYHFDGGALYYPY